MTALPKPDVVRETIDAVHDVDSSIVVVLGGQAAGDPSIATAVDAEAWAPDGLGAVDVISGLARARRRDGELSFEPTERLRAEPLRLA